jgi:hypothetical protein
LLHPRGVVAQAQWPPERVGARWNTTNWALRSSCHTIGLCLKLLQPTAAVCCASESVSRLLPAMWCITRTEHVALAAARPQSLQAHGGTETGLPLHAPRARESAHTFWGRGGAEVSSLQLPDRLRAPPILSSRYVGLFEAYHQAPKLKNATSHTSTPPYVFLLRVIN